MQYDGAYTLSSAGGSVTPDGSKGPMVANGKLGIVPMIARPSAEQYVLVSTPASFNSEFIKTPIAKTDNPASVLPVPGFGEFRFFDAAGQTTVVNCTSVSLFMDTGIYTSAYQVNAASDSALLATVEIDAYAVRHMPYCFVHTLRVTLTSAGLARTPTLYHVVGGTAGFAALDFQATAFDVTSDLSTNMLIALGKTARDLSVTVCATSCYLPEDAGVLDVKAGYNQFAATPYPTAYCKVKFGSSAVAGTQYRLHVLTTAMCSNEFNSPKDDSIQAMINTLSRANTFAAVMASVRSEHVSAWSRLWEGNVFIDPKTAATAPDLARINAVKRAARYALYNLYSVTRPGVDVELNPNTLAILDISGEALYAGDVWLLPCLLYFSTDSARSVLEHRRKTLAAANKYAAMFGKKGAKYPYLLDVATDNTVLGGAVLWDYTSPNYLFNSALIVINIWNYYRLTLDKDWLQSNGYPVMKNVCQYIVASATYDVDLGQYQFVNVPGLNGYDQNSGDVIVNDAFTVNAACLALRYAIEASYELMYIPNDDWNLVYFNTVIPTVDQNANYDVLKSQVSGTVKNPVAQLDYLAILTNQYDTVFYKQDERRMASSAIAHNVSAAFPDPVAVDTSSNTATFNSLVKVALFAEAAQYDTSYMTDCYDMLYSVVNAINTVDFMGNAGSRPGGTSVVNDVNTSAMLLMVLATCFGGVRVYGGVSQTRFYYEEMQLRNSLSGVLPETWRALRFTGLGSKGGTFVTINTLYY